MYIGKLCQLARVRLGCACAQAARLFNYGKVTPFAALALREIIAPHLSMRAQRINKYGGLRRTL